MNCISYCLYLSQSYVSSLFSSIVLSYKRIRGFTWMVLIVRETYVHNYEKNHSLFFRFYFLISIIRWRYSLFQSKLIHKWECHNMKLAWFIYLFIKTWEKRDFQLDRDILTWNWKCICDFTIKWSLRIQIGLIATMLTFFRRGKIKIKIIYFFN